MSIWEQSAGPKESTNLSGKEYSGSPSLDRTWIWPEKFQSRIAEVLKMYYIAVPRLSVDRILRLGTGWEPPICGSKMFERLPRPHLTKKFHFFFAKRTWHTQFLDGEFFWGPKKILSPLNWLFLGVPSLS